MNRRTMPFLLMLAAGAFTCIMTFINKCSIIDKLLSLAVALLVFYLLGVFIKKLLDYFDKQNTVIEEATEAQTEPDEGAEDARQNTDEGEKEK